MNLKTFLKTTSKPLLILFLLNFIWTISIFIAPYTVSPGSIKNLDGEANIINYAEKWNNLSLYPRIVYYFGDLNCHQKYYRSFYLNENQLPIDARMTSIFVFANFGFLLAMVRKPSRYLSIAVLNLFPEKWHNSITRIMGPNILLIVFLAFTILPVAIDGFAQLLLPYESTNLLRVLTGSTLGIGGAYILGAMLTGMRE